jgi:hypothetical protein
MSLKITKNDFPGLGVIFGITLKKETEYLSDVSTRSYAFCKRACVMSPLTIKQQQQLLSLQDGRSCSCDDASVAFDGSVTKKSNNFSASRK